MVGSSVVTWLPPGRPQPTDGRPQRRTCPYAHRRRPTGSLGLSAPLDRHDALRVLQLPPAADERAVKRAYRRLARAHHPDVGGEVATFHRLQQAYETLVGDGADGPPPIVPARPSRPREDWSASRTGGSTEDVDLDTVRWDLPLPATGDPLSQDGLARWLASDEVAVVRALTAASRAPGSRLNRAAPKLSSDLTASLEIGAARDDRDRVVVAIHLVARNRRARRVLDRVGLDGGWVRRRGTASTALRWTAAPGADRRVTALRTTAALATMLDRAGWPLRAWIVTEERGDP